MQRVREIDVAKRNLASKINCGTKGEDDENEYLRTISGIFSINDPFSQ